MQTRVRGSEHPATLNTLHNLSCTLYQLGEFDEAARLAEEAFDKRARVFGDEHPSTLSTMMVLAPALVQVGHHELGVSVAHACYETRRRLLGTAHMDTIAASIELDGLVAETSDRGLTAVERDLADTKEHLTAKVRELQGRVESVKHAPESVACKRRCHATGCQSDDVKSMCGRCGVVWYCSRECQVRDWKLHKPNCAHGA